MRYRRRRHRRLTPAQAKLQKLSDRNQLRGYVLLHGVGEAIKRCWDTDELKVILDIIATDLLPTLKYGEELQKRLDSHRPPVQRRVVNPKRKKTGKG